MHSVLSRQVDAVRAKPLRAHPAREPVAEDGAQRE